MVRMMVEELLPQIENWYSFLGSHKEMIEDCVRTRAYKRAIDEVVKEGDIVVDLGTGTGILAFFCVQSGAGRVYAIEQTEIIDLAKRIGLVNDMASKIVFIRGDSKEIRLPERVDVIVSETLGHFGVEEGMLESLVDARERFLRPGGVLIPRTLSLVIAPVEAPEIFDEMNYWNQKSYMESTSHLRLRRQSIMSTLTFSTRIICWPRGIA